MQVTTSAEAAARDRAAIEAGTPSFTLMNTAGTRAAAFIAARCANALAGGVEVFAGSGNNGGDAYVVAAWLVAHGASVVLHNVGEPRTDDARRAATMFADACAHAWRASAATAAPTVGTTASTAPTVATLVVDGVLGTGQRGDLRDAERNACRQMNEARVRGAVVIALDVPTGVNATTGECVADAVRATHTLALGTLKRGHVLARGHCGALTVLDIGLGAHADLRDAAWALADRELVASLLPRIAWNAHKGTRGRVAIVGGDAGMAGAIVLASRAALHTGAGLVYTHTAAASVAVMQASVPQAVARAWPAMPTGVNAVAIGPGLGRSMHSWNTLQRALDASQGVPTVLDADALTLLARGDAHDVTNGEPFDDALDERLDTLPAAERVIARIRAIAASRAVVLTPHVGEFARLVATDAATTLEARIAQASRFATATGAVVLLKGTPSAVVAPNEAVPTIVPRGCAVLATGGSGDLLTGVIGALLAQGVTPRDAAIVGAYTHGRAAERVLERAGGVRGTTLDDVLAELGAVWRELETPAVIAGDVDTTVLTELPDIS